MSEAKESKLLLRELPLYGTNFIELNISSGNLIQIRQLNKLSSIYDIDLLNLNSSQFSDINPDQILSKQQIRTNYFSSNTFKQFKIKTV